MYPRGPYEVTSCQRTHDVIGETEIRPEAAVAAKWWRDQLINNESLLNAPHLSEGQLALFETQLARRISLGLNDETAKPVLLSSALKPEGVLYKAASTAGMASDPIMFPMRTSMLVSEGRIQLRRLVDDDYHDLPFS